MTKLKLHEKVDWGGARGLFERQLAQLEPPIIVSFRDFQSENSEPCIRGVIAISVGGESGIN